ncbi:MAG: metallophosphoesterase family protein [Candidatus Hodarchaeota archaeon]
MIKQPIAIIADIHGNRWALEAVLSDIKRRGIQKIINLGDSFYDPLDPVGTFQMLTNNNILSILGNEDRVLLNSSKNNVENPTIKFVKQSLSEHALNWLASLKVNIIVNDDIFACYGSPLSDDDFLLEEIVEDGISLKNSQKLVENLSMVNQDIILCGHSHIPRTVYLPTGQFVINPGLWD